MTDLQKVEFEILKAFVGVCEELGLRYYLVCGTALGAVKYQGFIPWDDDVDVALPRSDYEVFCEKAQALLPEYYFLQTYRTDPNYPNFYCKIRDSRTTYIEKSVRDIKMNHGVYIDVFPLDGYPEDHAAATSLERKKRLFKLQLGCAFTPREGQKLTTKVFFMLERLLGFHKNTAKTAEKLDRLVSGWPLDTSKLWCNHGNWQGRLEYAPREQYGEGEWALFEGLKVRVPERYDEYLTQKYGDWRANLPLEQQVGHHYYSVMDVDKPYTEYVNQD